MTAGDRTDQAVDGPRVGLFSAAGLLVPALAGGAAGIGVWFTRAAVERVTAPDGAIRVAMLPSLTELVVLTAAGAAACAVIAYRLDRRPGGPRRDVSADLVRRSRDPFLPLFALPLLGLPYLPWIADILPGLVVIAGPARYVIWAVAGAGIVAALWGGTGAARSPVRAGPWIALVAGLGLFSIVGHALAARSPVFPGGDEPHYLIIAQSLWRDGDLKIENNHDRGDYSEYFSQPLEPHYLARGVDGEIYSIHPVGMPIVLAPVYALAGYAGVLTFIALVGAIGGALMWWWVHGLTGSPGAATFAWIGVCLTVPYFIHSFSVYPEIFAALCVIAIVSFTQPDRPLGRAAAVGTGLLLGALPWLSTKYSPMAAALCVIVLWRIWRREAGPQRLDGAVRRAVPVVLPFALSVAAWLAFFFYYWGSPTPTAPYSTYTQTNPLFLRVALPGYFFDQEYGLVPYAPVYILTFTGLAALWRAGGERRRLAIEILVVAGALFGTVGSYRIWWGGSAAPGRPVVAALLLLAAPVAWQYRDAAGSPLRRAAHLLLIVVGLSFTAIVVVAQQGLLLANERDGSAQLLEWLSSNWQVSAVMPSFTYHHPLVASAFAATWIGVLILAAAGLPRFWTTSRRPPGLGAASLVVIVTTVVSAVAAATLVGLVFQDALQPEIPLEARSRVRLLDQFDAAARPLTVVYDPVRLVAAADVPSLVRLQASPGDRRPRPPRPLLFNARYSLPAGEYEVRLKVTPATDAPGHDDLWLALQLGRVGRPLVRWPVHFPEDGIWRQRFTVPIDIGFVGFTASPAVERIARALELTPLRVVDVHARPRTDQVLAASAYGPATVFFHNEDVWPEPEGFWTPGGTAVPVTVATGNSGVRLRLHSGPVTNTVTLETPGWREELVLEPGRSQEVTVPMNGQEIIVLGITSSEGFVPAELEQGNPDRRRLGSWIEVVGG